MRRLDQGILLVVFLLLGMGLVQVYSSSFIFATESRGDGLFFFKRQILFAAVGLIVLFVSSHLPPSWWRHLVVPLWLLTTVLVILTFVPGFGLSAGGAKRWIRLGSQIVFEPSELLKFVFPLASALYLAKAERLGPKGHLLWFAALALPLVLVLRQPDFGTFAICLMCFLLVIFVRGLLLRQWLLLALLGLPLVAWALLLKAYRRERLLAFLDPWQEASTKGFQAIQSMLSFHSGGAVGVGLGQGQGKLFFLPESHTDFTLAVLGEETGFVGVMVVLALFGYLVFRGMQISFQSKDGFARFAALGLSAVFALAVFVNAGVALGLLPTKGLTLPFMSYGGSSLITNCLVMGVLLSLQRGEVRASESSDTTRIARGSKVQIKDLK